MIADDEPWNPGEWVERHGDYLYRFAQSRLHSSSDAEEAVQETLLSAWKNQDKFEGRAAERTWLTGILKYKIIDRFRMRSRDAKNVDDSVDVSELDALFDSTGHGVIPGQQWTGNPVDEIERGEFWAAFNDCVSVLPERTGSVFVMRELDQMDGKEICKVLDITPSNYWVRLHRARLKLRECLEQSWFQEQGL